MSFIGYQIDYELHSLPNRKVSGAKDHGKNYIKVRPPLVRHLLRNRLFNNKIQFLTERIHCIINNLRFQFHNFVALEDKAMQLPVHELYLVLNCNDLTDGSKDLRIVLYLLRIVALETGGKKEKKTLF